MANLNIKGLEKLAKHLDEMAKIKPTLKKIVNNNGDNLAMHTQENMTHQYRGHYGWVKGKGRVLIKATGTTKRSTVAHITDDGLSAIVAPTTAYFPYLEHGTRHMKARPTLIPAYKKDKEKFLEDVKNAVEKS